MSTGFSLGTLHNAGGDDAALAKKLARWFALALVEDQVSRIPIRDSGEMGELGLAEIFVDMPMEEIESSSDSSDAPSQRSQSAEPLKAIAALLDWQRLAPRNPKFRDPNEFRASHAPILVGAPGQGKSTLTLILAQLHRLSALRDYPAELLRELLTGDEQQQFEKARAALEDLSRSIGSPTVTALPLRVELLRLASWLEADASRAASPAEFLADDVRQHYQVELNEAELRSLADRFETLWLFDGLDEIDGLRREKVWEAIKDFYCLESQRVLITSRPVGHGGSVYKSEARWALAPLDTQGARACAVRSIEQRFLRLPHQASELVAQFERALTDTLTAQLASTPLHVQILLTLLDAQGVAARNRWDLFDRFYQIIYSRESRRNLEVEVLDLLREHTRHIDQVHERVALTLHARGDGVAAAQGITADEFRALVDEVLSETVSSSERRSKLVEALVRVLRDRLVLLVSKREGLIEFDVRSVQEFFAARALTTSVESDREVLERLRVIAKSSHWLQVYLFAIARWASVGKPLLVEATVELCRELDESSEEPERLAALGSQLAVELLDHAPLLRDDRIAPALFERVKAISDAHCERLWPRIASVVHRLSRERRTDLLEPWVVQLAVRTTERFDRWSRTLLLLAVLDVRGAREAVRSKWPENDEASLRWADFLLQQEPSSLWLRDSAAFRRSAWTSQILSTRGAVSAHESAARTVTMKLGSCRVRVTLLFGAGNHWKRLDAALETAGFDDASLIRRIARFGSEPTSATLRSLARELRDSALTNEVLTALFISPWPLMALRDALLSDSEIDECTSRWLESPKRAEEIERIFVERDGASTTDEELRSWLAGTTSDALDAWVSTLVAIRDMDIAESAHAGQALRREWLSHYKTKPTPRSERLARFVVYWLTLTTSDDVPVESLETFLPPDVGQPPKKWSADEDFVRWCRGGDPRQIDVGLQDQLFLLLPAATTGRAPSEAELVVSAIRGVPMIWRELPSSGELTTADGRAALVLARLKSISTGEVGEAVTALTDEGLQSRWGNVISAALHSIEHPTEATLHLLAALHDRTKWPGVKHACERTLARLLLAQPSSLSTSATWARLKLPGAAPQPARRHSDLPQSTPIHLSRVELAQLRRFESLELSPVVPEGDRGQFVLLLGDNGSGKTTILRALALALAPKESLDGVFGTLRSRLMRCSREEEWAKEASIRVQVGADTFRATISAVDQRESAALNGANPRPFVVGYGVRRGSSLGGVAREVSFEPATDLGSLFDRGETLVHGETWLKDQFIESPERFRTIARVLESMLPGVPEGGIVVRGKNVLVAVDDAAPVPLDALSDGYVTAAGWIIDLMARWIDRLTRQGREIPEHFNTTMTGVVLIDEIDLHLHPKWQRSIVSEVRTLFPRMTFVATTHNALTALGAQRGELWRLTQRPDATIGADQIDLPAGSRIEQLLTGPWFELASVVDEETQAKLDRHRALLTNNVPEDDRERREIEAFLRTRFGTYADSWWERAALEAANQWREEHPSALPPADSKLIERIRQKLAERTKQRTQ